MEDYTNYTNILSAEERTLLENLINKLAVSGIKQYNTQAAIILFTDFGSSREFKAFDNKFNYLK